MLKLVEMVKAGKDVRNLKKINKLLNEILDDWRMVRTFIQGAVDLINEDGSDWDMERAHRIKEAYEDRVRKFTDYINSAVVSARSEECGNVVNYQRFRRYALDETLLILNLGMEMESIISSSPKLEARIKELQNQTPQKGVEEGA